MIATKVLPAFYVLDLEGDAANLEWLFGDDFKIKHVRVGSRDFRSDLDATLAGTTAVNFIIEQTDVSTDKADQVRLNPDFFPSAPALQLTQEQLDLMEEIQEESDKMIEQGQVALKLTKNFDELGDFVTSHLSSSGDDFKIDLKIAINPNTYMDEKAKVVEWELNRSAGPHRSFSHQTKIH